MERRVSHGLRLALVALAVMLASCNWFDSHAVPPSDADAETDVPVEGIPDAETDTDLPLDGDMPQDPSTDEDAADVEVENVFTPLGLPPGGDFMDLAVVPNRPETLYALAAYQRIFRSDNGTSTWTECTLLDPNIYTVAPTADPPGDVYVGGENDVFVSHDGCASWEPTGLNLETEALLILGDGDVLAGTEQGLRRFNGSSWSALTSTLEGHYVASISGNADGEIVFAGSWGNGMARSSDGGSSWESCNSGLTSLDVHHLAVAPGDPQRVFAYTETGVERSIDGGDTWSLVHGDSGWTLAVDPFNADFVIIYQWNHLLESWDGGDTFGWEDRRSANMSLAEVRDILFHPSTEGLLYLVTVRGVFMLDDVSTWNWTERDAGLSAWSIWDIAAAPGAGTLYLANPTGVLRSTDGGATWSIEIEGFPTSQYSANSYTVSVAVDASDQDTVAASGQFVMLSTDGGSTFSMVYNPGETDNWWVTTVEISGASLYAGTTTRFLHSPDSGETWLPHLIDGSERRVNAIMVYEESPPTVIVATETGLFSTSDNGESFDAVSDGLSSLEVHALARLAGGRLFAATPDGVYSAAGPGETWELRSPAACWVEDVMVNASSVFAACNDGVFWSGDEGLTWNELPGMANRWPVSLGADDGGSLLVGTWGFGIHATPLP